MAAVHPNILCCRPGNYNGICIICCQMVLTYLYMVCVLSLSHPNIHTFWNLNCNYKDSQLWTLQHPMNLYVQTLLHLSNTCRYHTEVSQLWRTTPGTWSFQALVLTAMSLVATGWQRLMSTWCWKWSRFCSKEPPLKVHRRESPMSATFTSSLESLSQWKYPIYTLPELISHHFFVVYCGSSFWAAIKKLQYQLGIPHLGSKSVLMIVEFDIQFIQWNSKNEWKQKFLE
jgi:hypothetical protein